jgi:hypothetical protein
MNKVARLAIPGLLLALAPALGWGYCGLGVLDSEVEPSDVWEAWLFPWKYRKVDCAGRGQMPLEPEPRRACDAGLVSAIALTLIPVSRATENVLMPSAQEIREAGCWKIKAKTECLGTEWTSDLLLRDPEASHHRVAGDRWQTDEALRLPVLGPLYVFGQVGAVYNTESAQEMKVKSCTGLGCRLAFWQGAEVQFRGGPAVSHAADPLRPERLPRESSDLLLQLQARTPLVGPLKLEYDGTALPALGPLERNRVNHDLRFALPLGETGHFHFGAKHKWEDTPAPRPLTDGMEVYIGVGLRR